MENKDILSKTKIPNYVMLRLMLIGHHRVLNNNPATDKMPSGQVCPGYDVKLIPFLAVLKYLHGINTQWSCQGNHKEYTTKAYVLLAPDHYFPQDLISLIKSNNLFVETVSDYDITNKITEKTREKLTVSKSESKIKIQKENNLFIDVVNEWALSEIKSNLKFMKDSYFSDVVKLYS